MVGGFRAGASEEGSGVMQAERRRRTLGRPRLQLFGAGLLVLFGGCSSAGSKGADAGWGPCGALGQACCYLTGSSCDPGLTCESDLVCIVPVVTMSATDAGPGDAGASNDSGMPDTGMDDAGTTDAGVGDGGATDGGATDGGTTDAGTSTGGPDAGMGLCGCNSTTGCQACVGNLICDLTEQCDVPTYVANGDGTVTDSSTGLVWQQTAPSSPCPADGTAVCTWADAQTYCQKLSLGSGSPVWRLPTLPELFSLIESWNDPSIDPTAFPNAPEAAFWTSTTAFTSDAFVVYFNYGGSAAFGTDFDFNVRCVH